MSKKLSQQGAKHIVAPPAKPENNITEPCLSELSDRDKPWDKHRGNADKVASHYQGSKFHKYAVRMQSCSEFLGFGMLPDPKTGELKLKLKTARFCRVRHCPVCQWRRSLMWKAKAYKVLPLVMAKYPKYRWLFLTLTVKNCPITELRSTLQWMNKAWQRLHQRKMFPAIGWLKSVEVTRGQDGSAHPHFHCLLLVPSSYFSGRDYMKQADWCQQWKECLRVDYTPILDIKAVKKGQTPMQLVPEILKYCIKESDLINDRDWFLELTQQMQRLNCVSTGGVLKEYLKALEQEPEDLIGKSEEDEEEEEEDQPRLFFSWRRLEKRYRLSNPVDVGWAIPLFDTS